MRILLVYSNPSSTPRLAQAAELRHLRRDLRSYEYRDQIQLVDRHAVTIEDFVEAVSDVRPAIVHFSGHGESDAIFLCDENDQEVEVGPEQLRAILSGKGVNVVYLSACYSEAMAEAVSGSVDCVIGSSASLEDQNAIWLARTFYKRLGEGDSAADAFQHARDVSVARGFGDQGLAIRGDFAPGLADARKQATAVLGQGAKIKSAVTAAVVAGLSLALTPFTPYLLSEPWQSVWLLALLAGMGGLLWVWRVSWLPLLNYRYWAFLGVYVLFFTVASSADVLEFRRTLIGVSESETPSDPLGIGWMGDWRYKLFPASTDASLTMLVVTLSDETPGVRRRSEILDILSWAEINDARLVALDFRFMSEVPALDGKLCDVVESLRAGGTPVIGAYFFDRVEGGSGVSFVPQQYVESIRRCFERDNLGHAVAYLGSKQKIRGIPTLFNNDAGRPSFSYLIAKMASEESDFPSARTFPRFFQFLPPATPVLIEPYSDPMRPELSTVVADRVLIVGGGKYDTFATPFDDRPVSGALLHAYAAHSYFTDTKVTIASPVFASVFVFSGCAMLSLLALNGATRRTLYGAAAVASAAVVGVSIVAAFLGRVILPIIYPLLAMWLLLFLLPYMTTWVGEVKSEEPPAAPD